MNKKFLTEVKNLDADKLRQRGEELRRELYDLRVSAMSASVKDSSKFRQTRRNIARVETLLKQKQAAKQDAA